MAAADSSLLAAAHLEPAQHRRIALHSWWSFRRAAYLAAGDSSPLLVHIAERGRRPACAQMLAAPKWCHVLKSGPMEMVLYLACLDRNGPALCFDLHMDLASFQIA